MSFDAPIGNAQRLFEGFDGRVIHGVDQMRQFVQADLVDFMHLVIAPITLGAGVSRWDGLSGIEDRWTIETVSSPGGLTHQLWNRKQAP